MRESKDGRERYKKRGIISREAGFINSYAIHLHISRRGQLKKDGPSAGITMATSYCFHFYR